MTTLATHALEDPDQIALFADNWSMTHKPFADAFRDVCIEQGQMNGGWVDPNLVRLRLLDHEGWNCRQYSALWSTACSKDGYLDKTDRPCQIEGEGSRGNTNKSTTYRRLRGWVA